MSRPSPSEPARPAFTWAQVGVYLLSERTLHALLGLGAFLTLASGFVISIVNPTGLGALPHLGVVMATMAAFYAAGYFVRQRLGLITTGTALLGIGAAFLPLSIWTLGEPRLLNWAPATVWLVASLVCLPLYLCSHVLLRDRGFAALTALAGASELLAGLNWLAVPAEWALCGLLVLAMGYLVLSVRLSVQWRLLGWALFWTAQVVTPVVMALLLAGKFFPVLWEVALGRAPGGLFEYSAGGAWWLGTGFYALAGRSLRQRRYAFLSAWVLPFAVLFTLTKAPWSAAWYNLCLALLAAGYLLYGRQRQRTLNGEAAPRLLDILAQPAYQVGVVLTIVSVFWPWQTLESRVPTLYLVTGLYALAAYGLRQVAFRYAAAYLFPVAVASSLDQLSKLQVGAFAPAWHGVVFGLLALAYLGYGRLVLTGRQRQVTGTLDQGLVAEPAYQVAWLLTLVAIGWPAARSPEVGLTLFVVTATYALAAYLFRHVAFRYAAAGLLPLAVVFSLDSMRLLGFRLFALEWDNVALALLAVGYLLFARFIMSKGASRSPSLAYLAAEPVYQFAALLTVVAVLWPVQTLDSRILTLYLVTGLYAGAAYLFSQVVFRYAAAYLLPLAVGFSLERLGHLGVLAPAWHSVAFALLAVAYLLFGRFVIGAGASRPATYRCLLGEPVYQVAVLLTLVAVVWPMQTLDSRILTLYLVVGGYALAAYLFRLIAFRYVAAYLLPVAVWSSLDKLGQLGFAAFAPAWHAVAFALLAVAYLLFGRFVLRAGTDRPTTLGVLIVEPTYQAASLLTMLAVALAQPLETRVWTLYSVAAGYGLAAYLFRLVAFRYVAAYLVPVAVGLSLHKLGLMAVPGFAPSWHPLAFALLALGYLLFGRFVLQAGRTSEGAGSYSKVAREPVYQVALLLTYVLAGLGVLGGIWPADGLESTVLTLFVVIGTYALAAVLLRQRAWAYVAAYMLPAAYAVLLKWSGLDDTAQPLAWVLLAAALIALAEMDVRRTGEMRRSLKETVIGLGRWRSLFAAPLFSSGYAVSLLGLGLALGRYSATPSLAGMRVVDNLLLLTLVGLVVLASLSAVARRASCFLYPATWLLPAPVLSAAASLLVLLGWRSTEYTWVLVLAWLGMAYVAAAYVVDRAGGHYAKPVYLMGYGLSLATMLLATPDRRANEQTVAFSILVYAWSAWLVHRGRHPAYLWVVERLFGSPTTVAFQTAHNLFLYLVVWLSPVWLVLEMSLHRPAPSAGEYGMVLALLAPAYVALGLAFRQIRSQYRLPWYLAGYALSVVGRVVATGELGPQMVTTALAIALYSGSAVLFRAAGWLYLAALLTPHLLGDVLTWFGVPGSYYGLALVGLGLVYSLLGAALHHGRKRGQLAPINGPICPYAVPFLVVGYAVTPLGLALVVNEPRLLILSGFALAAVSYLYSAFLLRQPLFAYLVAGTVAVVYLVGMTLSPLAPSLYGLGLLPGVVGYLAVAEVLRRRADLAVVPRGQAWTDALGWWAPPCYAVAYLGTVAVVAWSAGDPITWTLAWWSVAAVYAVSAVCFRNPGWLHAAVPAGVIAWLGAVHVVVPGLAVPQALGLLLVPAWACTWLAYALARRHVSALGPSPHPKFAVGRGLTHRWAARLLGYAVVLVVIAVMGSAPDAQAGVWAAASTSVLFVASWLAWRALATMGAETSMPTETGHGEAWASLVAAMLASEHGLRLAGIGVTDQPPYWAAWALVSAVLAIAMHAPRLAVLSPWRAPLYWSSLVVGTAAMVAATLAQLALASRESLQPLAMTVALSGLSLIAHAFHQRRRQLIYLGVALFEVAYMLELAFFELGEEQFFVLPVGLYLLGIAYLEWRRGSVARVKQTLEGSALLVLLGVSLLQALGLLGAGGDRTAYATFMLLEGLALFGLGAIVHWQRTFIAGGLAAIIAVCTLLPEPLRAMNTWYLVALIGVAILALAVFLDRERHEIPTWLDEWRRRLETWD